MQDILNIYDLPNLQCLSKSLTSKEIWKIQVKRAINKHWSELLQKEALEKSTLKYMNIDLVGIGRTVVDFLHVRAAQTHTSLQFSYTQSANIDKALVYAWIVPFWADQLLPQLLMEQLDTFPTQYRHIEHMHEGVWLKIYLFFTK